MQNPGVRYTRIYIHRNSGRELSSMCVLFLLQSDRSPSFRAKPCRPVNNNDNNNNNNLYTCSTRTESTYNKRCRCARVNNIHNAPKNATNCCGRDTNGESGVWTYLFIRELVRARLAVPTEDLTIQIWSDRTKRFTVFVRASDAARGDFVVCCGRSTVTRDINVHVVSHVTLFSV